MAVNTGNNGPQDPVQKPQQQAPYGGAQRHTGGTQNTQSDLQQRAGLGSINTLLRRSGTYDRSESRSAEALRGLKDISKSLQEAQGLEDNFDLIRFDRDENRVGLSAILIVKTLRLNNELHAAVRTLLLDSDAITLRPRIIELGPQRIEVPTLAQDTFDERYWNKISDYITRLRGADRVVCSDAGAMVIPSEFDFKDEVATARLLITSVNLCDDIVARISGEQPLTISNVKRHDERLTARVDFSGRPVENVVGHPIRSDIRITMSRQVTSQNTQDDYYEQEGVLNSVSGFINLEYAPAPAQIPQATAWGQPQQQATQVFSPTFVITEVAQADWIQAHTPELYLLALSNAYRVTGGTQWVRQFLPQVGKKGIDVRDPGALGYFGPTQSFIETKSDTFTDKDFVDLMGALVREHLTFVLDVNPMGDHAAVENYFIDAAFPGPNQERAKALLIQAGDNLTGGRFSPIFNNPPPEFAGAVPVVPYQQEINLGYYTDEEGERRDIRDLDVLAMANLTKGNLQDFFEWYRTYVDVNTHMALNLQARERWERQYLSKSLVVTGRAIRVMFHPWLILALDQATREAGAQVDFEHMSTLMGNQRFVGNTLVNQYAVSRNATVGYGGGHTPAGTGYTYTAVHHNGRLY